MAVIGVAVILHLVGLVVFAARVVHHHDEGAVERVAYGLIVERLGGIALGGSQGASVLVGECVGKLLHGFADSESQDVVDGAQHLGLALADVLSLLAGSHHRAQFKTILTQLGRDNPCHAAGIVRRVGLGHHCHRHQSVLLGEVGHATEGTAIVDGVLEEEAHTLVVDGLAGIVDDALEHEVGLLQLVVEEEISL